MPYPLQRKYKPGNRLTPEEDDVLAALSEYTDDPSRAAMDDFVPTRVLYATYLKHANRYDQDLDAPEILTERQFGSALRRVFPELDEHRDFRVQRTLPDGSRVWGYIGLTGPGTIKVQPRPGCRLGATRRRELRVRQPVRPRHAP